MTGICNLCLKEKELIKKSHIIPEFLYRQSGMYDDKHRMNFLCLTKNDILQNRKTRQKQSGIYDRYILCADCDNRIISSYENYASNAIYGTNVLIEHCPDCINYGDTNPIFSICRNVDYAKYKLFLLSILFRASITKDVFFDEVKLSMENQEKLRKMVYEGNPGKFNDFPFLVSTFVTSENIPTDIFINPAKAEQNGKTTYTFVFAAMSFLFYEGENLETDEFDFFLMKPDNVLKIYHLNGEHGKQYFNAIIGLK